MKGLITPVREESTLSNTTRLILEDSLDTMREYLENNYNIEFKVVKQKGQLVIFPKLIKKTNKLEA